MGKKEPFKYLIALICLVVGSISAYEISIEFWYMAIVSVVFNYIGIKLLDDIYKNK